MNSNIKQPVYKKWWFWLIIGAVVIGGVLGVIGIIAHEKNDESTNLAETEQILDDDYSRLLSVLKNHYGPEVSGSNKDVWKHNNAIAPSQYPYEYVDFSYDNGDFFFVVKLITDPVNLDYFMNNETCMSAVGGDSNCIFNTIKDNVLYKIVIHSDKDESGKLGQISQELESLIMNF